MKFSVFQASQRGGRAKNEDRVGHCRTRASALFMLADGMGGHPEGEVAAKLALRTLTDLFEIAAQPRVADPQEFLRTALGAAHRAITRYANDRAMLDMPRTTLVAVRVQDGRACWIHAGDSRLYHVRGGRLLFRTRDHSFVEHRPADAPPFAGSANRNMLFACLGSPTDPMFDLSEPQTLLPGDRLMLCSDGLWGNLPDADLLAGLAADHPVADAVQTLVAQALKAGGRRCDNVTALALHWDEPPVQDASRLMAEAGRDTGFESTLEGPGADDQSHDDFDDAAIERSIAEINEAIRRSNGAARKS